MTKNRGDSFGDFLDTEERPTAGVRGYQARQQFQASLKRDPDAVYSAVRRRLAEAIETDEAILPGAAMRAFFTNKAPLGSTRGFTYVFRVRHRAALGSRGAGRPGCARSSGGSST